MPKLRLLLLLMVLLASPAWGQSLLITNVKVFDGSGRKPFPGEVLVSGDSIVAVSKQRGKLRGDRVMDGRGLALAPGFIDMHSHADDGIFDQPHDAVIRQGITTAVVGQDGSSQFPLSEFLTKVEQQPPAMNLASMAGHATIREKVLGKNYLRAAAPEEVRRMRELVAQEMRAGAFGLSSGLEYDVGQFATTSEMAALAEIAGRHGGIYISHVRDEGNGAFRSFEEIIEIGRRARVPVHISHIKLATTPVWLLAGEQMPRVFAAARAAGVDLKADVYPYTYWQSTLRVIVLDRDYYNPKKVAAAIAENGGAGRIRLTRYEPAPELAGKTLEEVSEIWQITPAEAFMRIVKATLAAGDFSGAEEGVIVESMNEQDLAWFLAHPRIMFCSDGELQGPHPRGAGSFPRILGRYVREQKLIPLEFAIYKATALPAQQLGLVDRGRVAAGYKADLILFDPARVADRSSIEQPLAPPAGIEAVMVNGVWVVAEGEVTGARPGRALRRHGAAKMRKNLRQPSAAESAAVGVQ